MFGAALALTADSHADPRSTYAQVTKSISKTLRTWTVERNTYASLRTGDWPNQFLTLAQGTLSNLPAVDESPAIAVVIDDLGTNAARTSQAIGLPANVTMSFLPYPSRSRELSRRAHLAGHEVIVHLPMQPAGNENPGERALKVGLPPDELQQRLVWALSRVSDYDGVNNHMGSRFDVARRSHAGDARTESAAAVLPRSRTTEKPRCRPSRVTWTCSAAGGMSSSTASGARPPLRGSFRISRISRGRTAL
jgi:hypothetical protein